MKRWIAIIIVIALLAVLLLPLFLDGGAKPAMSNQIDVTVERGEVKSTISSRGITVSYTHLDVYKRQFHHDASITRAEAVTILNRALGRTPDSSAISGGSTFSDVSETFWAYKDILEASREHENN